MQHDTISSKSIKHVLFSYRPRTGFDKSSLERLEQLFIKTVGNEKEIRREEFKKIVTSKNVRSYHTASKIKTTIDFIFPPPPQHSLSLQPFFTERVFQIFDKDNSGSISLQVKYQRMWRAARHNPTVNCFNFRVLSYFFFSLFAMFVLSVALPSTGVYRCHSSVRGAVSRG